MVGTQRWCSTEAGGSSSPLRVVHVMGRMMGGGVESTVMNHYRHIDRQRIQFDFVVGTDSNCVPREEIEDLGGRVVYVPRYQDTIGFVRGLREVLAVTRPRIVQSHLNSLSVIPLTVAAGAHVPVRIAHSHSTSAPGELGKNLAKGALRPISRLAPTHLAACSQHAAKWLFGDRAVAYGQVHMVRNAIDVSEFAYDADVRQRVRRRLGIPPSTHVIGQVGRLSVQKNQLYLVPIIEELVNNGVDLMVLLVGDGDLRPRIEHEIARRKLTPWFNFLGTSSSVGEYYQAMDVLAMPSTYEGFGMVAVEAQAAGLRVIASDRVPTETQLTDLVTRLPLNAPMAEWAAALGPQSKAGIRRGCGKEIISAGYDIKSSAKDLAEWYLTLADDDGPDGG